MKTVADIIAIANTQPDSTRSAIETLIAVRVEDLIAQLDVDASDVIYFALRDLADAAYRQGLDDGVVCVGQLVKKRI